MINIFLNGKKSTIDKSINIHDFIISQGLNDKMIAVAVKLSI